MPGLLDYIKGYQHGGGVDFDPYADTSQADMLTQLGIEITDPDAYGLLPTYDPTGADITRGKYNLTTAGLSDTLATARRGSTGNLLDLTQQGQLKQAGSGFAGSGAGVQAMTNVRSDIISGFGDVSADIGRREDKAYLDLQRDIFDERRGYERDLLAAIGDLPGDSWSFGEDEETTLTCEQQNMQTCPDGSCAPWDGTCAGQGQDPDACPTLGQIKCPDGTCVWGDESGGDPCENHGLDSAGCPDGCSMSSFGTCMDDTTGGACFG